MEVMEMSSGLSEEARDKLEGFIVKTMAEAHVPGLSIALVKDGEVVYARGFGARNLEKNVPATPNTLYGVGSCTKSFTALAIMQLVEEGRLDLEDPVGKYVPLKLGMKEKPIRIHHLLTHSSGIPSLGVAVILITRMTGREEHWIPMSSLEDFLRHLNGASGEVAAEPGERFFYFNSGYTLLGEVVERVSGMRYEEYVRERILKPLRMNRSTFLKEEFEKDPDTMTAYWKEKDGSLTPTVHPFHKFIYAPGGLLSSVMELTNYLTMNINGGVFEG
ncbi:serine hydrolase, partial [Candidatus Bathyarchaeota archaeon]